MYFSPLMLCKLTDGILVDEPGEIEGETEFEGEFLSVINQNNEDI